MKHLNRDNIGSSYREHQGAHHHLTLHKLENILNEEIDDLVESLRKGMEEKNDDSSF